MNWVDAGLLVVVLLGVVGGYYRGFISGTFQLANWLGSLFLALLFNPYVVELCDKVGV